MLIITVILIGGFFSWVGYKYVAEGSKTFHNRLESRRKYVKLHKDCFGIKDGPGTPIDKRQIYVLSLEELGVREDSLCEDKDPAVREVAKQEFTRRREAKK